MITCQGTWKLLERPSSCLERPGHASYPQVTNRPCSVTAGPRAWLGFLLACTASLKGGRLFPCLLFFANFLTQDLPGRPAGRQKL